MTLEVHPIPGFPDVQPGDDLASMLADPLRAAHCRDGDVVVITQKIVSKAEGRLVPAADRDMWIERETAHVVAQRDDLTIARTRHGFVCANAGVDASNVRPGMLSLLPEDPDGSAERLRQELVEALGSAVAVVITDTFGRPWREGLVDVAIGVAGMPAVLDLRGGRDHGGRELEATVIAVADQVAAAAGVVMGKAARIPVALVRGLDVPGPAGRAQDLVRDPSIDLFRESPLQALHARRTIRSFGPGAVPAAVVEASIAAACTAPAPHHSRPWRFTVLETAAARRVLLATMADAWRADLRADGTDEAVIERRIAKSHAILGAAPILIVPWVVLDRAHRYPDAERSDAERAMFLLSGGAAIQNLLLGLHAHDVASCWISSTLFCQEETRAALDGPEGAFALGIVAAGPMPEGGAPGPRPPIDLGPLVDRR